MKIRLITFTTSKYNYDNYYLTKVKNFQITSHVIMSSEVQIKPISESLEIGTRPHWDAATQSLYFVDLPPSKIYKYQPATKTLTSATVGKTCYYCQVFIKIFKCV